MAIRIAPAAAFIMLVPVLLAACSNPWGDRPASELPKPLRYAVGKPSNLVFGNYCGIGTRTGDLTARPVDQLDDICFRHDSCYVERTNHCICDQALVRDASALRDDASQPAKTRRRAGLLVRSFSLGVCRVFPEGFMPPRPRDRRELGLEPSGQSGTAPG
ncbi:hypothetical protein [Mesorhizobium marinum]|uniref:hypothetical protein n=1 Tax=Mesorhizobium marinum TaxID=3228790 RepID=UPI003465ACB6